MLLGSQCHNDLIRYYKPDFPSLVNKFCVYIILRCCDLYREYGGTSISFMDCLKIWWKISRLVNQSKCEFEKSEILYLGHIINKECKDVML